MNKKIILTVAGLLVFVPILFGKKSSGESGGGGGFEPVPIPAGGYVDSNGNYTGTKADYAGGPLTDAQLQSAFDNVKSAGGYSKRYMNEMERIYRIETGHFKSGQFASGYTAGMRSVGTTFPFGWNSLQTYAQQNNISPSQFGVSQVFMVGGQPYQYVTFPNFQTALSFMAWFIKNIRGGDILKWGFGTATTSPEAIAYRGIMNNIRLRYTV